MLNPYSLRLLTRAAIRSTNPRCFTSHSSRSSATEEFLAKVGRSRKAAAVEAAKPDAEFYTEKPEYPPIAPPFEDGGLEAWKAEKKEFAEFVKAMPTAEEKIFAVNPYERPWTKGEMTWHRDYMHPRPEPRAIFRVHSVPQHYNLLPFYQFITKTHCIDGLPSAIYEKGENIDRETEEFTSLALELIRNEQRSYGERQFSSREYVYNVVDQLVNAACTLFSSNFPHLAEAQIARSSSLRAFWVRDGFQMLYDEDDVKPVYPRDNWKGVILGDDRRRRGEFAFCLRENMCVSVRNRHPLPEVVLVADSLCRTAVAPFVYAPLTVGLLPDNEGPTYMTPGYEYGDAYEFNSLQFYSIDSVAQIVKRFLAADQSEYYEECLRSAAVTLSFATLIGEAHYLGFTQHNDLTYPLATQMILTDGQFWHFSIYQLNSIAVINRWEESESPSNLAWCSGTMKLYDSVDRNGNFQGLNKDVLKLVLKCLLVEPKERIGLDMRPYLINRATADEALVKSAQAHVQAITSLMK